MRRPATLNQQQAEEFLYAVYRPLTHVSASAIQTFQDCQRKFFSRYILREREPGTAATELGSEIHDYLETYILTGAIPDTSTSAGSLASLALEHIPAPMTENVGAEIDLDALPLTDACVVPFRGFIDLLDTRDEKNIILTDYKTSSNVKKYGKSPSDLAENTQMVIYAKHVFDNFTEAETLTIRHIYLQTKGAPLCKVVSVEVSKEQIDKAFQSIREIVKEMKEASEKKAEELRKNEGHCFAWGQMCSNLSACKNPNKITKRSESLEALIKSLRS